MRQACIAGLDGDARSPEGSSSYRAPFRTFLQKHLSAPLAKVLALRTLFPSIPRCFGLKRSRLRRATRFTMFRLV